MRREDGIAGKVFLGVEFLKHSKEDDVLTDLPVQVSAPEATSGFLSVTSSCHADLILVSDVLLLATAIPDACLWACARYDIIDTMQDTGR